MDLAFPGRDDIERLVDPHPLPSFVRVDYDPPTETVTDPVETVRSELARLAPAFETLPQGARVAVGVGSRGIHDIDRYTAAVVAALADRGFDPVVVPAMGSHGGATPDGQRAVLSTLGITEAAVGAPIDARMETDLLAEVTVGATTYPVYFSTAAREADAVLVLNRVKPHTSFTGHIESGLCKMLVAGLGKQRGAKAFHATALSEGYVPALEAAVAVVRESVPLVGGIALVENADEETAHVEAIPADSILDREPELLERARSAMATLPVEDLHLLVVDELGKEISGAGMDTNVIGRYRVRTAEDPDTPDIDLIYARGLSARTKGNGLGIGLADLTRRAALADLDVTTTYANALTSGSFAKAAIPVVAPDDELALHIAMAALGGADPATVRVAWIRNTQDLGDLYVSTALVDDLPATATVTDAVSLAFTDGTATFEPR